MRLTKQKALPRGAGVLLPISALPSPYGIGTLGKAAENFIDFLQEAGQRYWSILPIGPTGFGDSPYQSFSAFAGNPYFIDLDSLCQEGLLYPNEMTAIDWGEDPTLVDYGKLFQSRLALLKKAFSRARHRAEGAYFSFCTQKQDWLDDYAVFMTLKERFGYQSFSAWPTALRQHKADALQELRPELEESIAFWKYLQFLFFKQWQHLRAYAEEKGIVLMGDLPIYVAPDSADLWASPGLFQLDQAGHPTAVAGVPPDRFAKTGQRWGNPLYNWTAMEQDDFAWWKRRIQAAAGFYEILRIDHFIGLSRYYAIPADSQTAERGEWREGPGKRLFTALEEAKGTLCLVAEDLGVMTEEGQSLLANTGLPGMKVLEFAFDSGAENAHLPFHYPHNCVVYGGTHDNETLTGFFAQQTLAQTAFAQAYLQVDKKEELPQAVMRAAYASVADVAILQAQDWLLLGNEARMNTPAVLGGNWRWRIQKEQLTPQLAAHLRALAALYGRTPAN